MPAMGSQAAAVLRDPPDAIELLDKLDRELLTSDDAEQLFRRLEGSAPPSLRRTRRALRRRRLHPDP